MYILITVWFPASKSIEVGKKTIEVNERFPDDESILKTILPGGLMRTKNGIKGISVFEVVEGKFEQAYERAGDILSAYAEVDGLNCRIDTMTTGAEAMESIGLALPA